MEQSTTAITPTKKVNQRVVAVGNVVRSEKHYQSALKELVASQKRLLACRKAGMNGWLIEQWEDWLRHDLLECYHWGLRVEHYQWELDSLLITV